MPQVKPQAPPGFVSQATQVQAKGAFFAGNLITWRGGFTEKMGGWRRLVQNPFLAIIRRMHAWLDLGNKKNLLVATDLGTQLVVQSSVYTLGRQVDLQGGYIPEIGPIGAATKFSVGLNSTTVTVKTSAIAAAGGTFLLRIGISIGGRTILAGSFFTVKDVIDGVGFTFDMPLPALTAETDTYGVPLLTNDIVNGMTVTWKAHGLAVGQTARLAQGTKLQLGTPDAAGKYSKVDFSAPGGTVVTVDTVPDADHFTFKMGTLGTGDGTGGTDHQVFVGSSVQHPTGGIITSTTGVVVGLAVQTPLGNPQKSSWFLANLGETGLVLATDGPLQAYVPPITDGPFLTPVGGAAAGAKATAPQKSKGMTVAMPQGQVILWGTESVMGDPTTQDPLFLRWSHAGIYKDSDTQPAWNLSVSNQAGSMRLYQGSRIMAVKQAPQALLILTDTDCWQMSYIGPPLVYGFNIMGSGCGLKAPHAVAVIGRRTVWQGEKNFWVFDGAVQPVQCSVYDYIFKDIDELNANKCHAGVNSVTNEVAFYFPSRHTMINVDKNLLLFSQLFNDLSAWILTNALANKFSLFHTLYLYEPEYQQSGWFDHASGLAPVSWLDRDLGAELESIVLAPDGTDTSFLLQESDVNGEHSVSQIIEKAGDRILYTLSIYAHDSSTRNLALRAVGDLGSVFAVFDVAAGNLVDAGVTSPQFTLIDAHAMTDGLGLGRPSDGPANGWRRYVLTFLSDDSPTLEVFFNIANGTQLSYQGTPPNGALIWGAQLVLGSDPLPYQKTGGTQRQNETRRYVKINIEEGFAWDSGRLGRSAWLDTGVWGTPLGADITPLPLDTSNLVTAEAAQAQATRGMRNLIQQHEDGFDDDLEPMRGVFVETGMTELGDGSNIMLIDYCQPDMKWFGRNGGLKMFLRAAHFAQGPTHLYGPYSITPGTEWFDPRVRARYTAVRYEWDEKLGFSARVGATTFMVKRAGRLP